MNELIEQRIDCPYCGESLDILVDASAGSMDYIEDCQVCCRPIEFRLAVDEMSGNWTLIVLRDDT